MISQAPATSAVAVTPHDTNAVAQTRGLYVGTAGALTVRMVGSQQNVTFANVAAGSLIPICVDRVLATGTDASDIVALL